MTAQSFLDVATTKYQVSHVGHGPAYFPGDIRARHSPIVIVYGTVREAGTNRYVAEQVQAGFRGYSQREMAIYKDFEAPESILVHKDVIFIGRPETNSALGAWSDRIGLDYQGAEFKVDGKTYVSERNALAYATKNPLDPTHMVAVYAGNSPLETQRATETLKDTSNTYAGMCWAGEGVAIILEDGKSIDQTDRRP